MTYLTHEKYNDGIAYNDVALALVSGVKFTKRIYPICIPSSPVVYQDHLKNNFVEILGFAIENESEFNCLLAFANNKAYTIFLDEEANNFLWRLDENGLLLNKKSNTNWKYGSRKWTFEEGGRIVVKDGKN